MPHGRLRLQPTLPHQQRTPPPIKGVIMDWRRGLSVSAVNISPCLSPASHSFQIGLLESSSHGLAILPRALYGEPEFGRTGLGPVHTNATSTIRVSRMKPRKSTSSFSKDEKIQKALQSPEQRSTSLRLLYISMSYVHGERSRTADDGSESQRQCELACLVALVCRSITIDKFSRCGPRRLSSLRPSSASWDCPAERAPEHQSLRASAATI